MTETLIQFANDSSTAKFFADEKNRAQLALAATGAVAAGRIEEGNPKQGALPAALHEQAAGMLKTLMTETNCAAAVRAATESLVPEAQAQVMKVIGASQ